MARTERPLVDRVDEEVAKAVGQRPRKETVHVVAGRHVDTNERDLIRRRLHARSELISVTFPGGDTVSVYIGAPPPAE